MEIAFFLVKGEMFTSLRFFQRGLIISVCLSYIFSSPQTLLNSILYHSGRRLSTKTSMCSQLKGDEIRTTCCYLDFNIESSAHSSCTVHHKVENLQTYSNVCHK